MTSTHFRNPLLGVRLASAIGAMLSLPAGGGRVEVLRRPDPTFVFGRNSRRDRRRRKAAERGCRDLRISDLSFDALIFYGAMREPQDWMPLASGLTGRRTPRFLRFDPGNAALCEFFKAHRTQNSLNTCWRVFANRRRVAMFGDAAA